MVKGYTVALLVLFLFAVISHGVRVNVPQYLSMNDVMYYWFCFTTLTGIWEFFYITSYKPITIYAQKLKETNTHVWTTNYKITAVLPHNTAMLFYAEYGAHADREYMSTSRGDFWSRLIESSHALFCGVFCLGALIATYYNQATMATWLAATGMGAQFMNSFLYMGQYFLECADKNSPNYNCPDFPLGKLMMKRWFMWVNLAWLLFPAFIVCHNLTTLVCISFALLHFTENNRSITSTAQTQEKIQERTHFLKAVRADEELVNYVKKHLSKKDLQINGTELNTDTIVSICDITRLFAKIIMQNKMHDPTDTRRILYQTDKDLVNLLTKNSGFYTDEIRDGTFRLNIFNIQRFLIPHLNYN